MLQAVIHNNITVNILVGYGDWNNGTITGLTTSAVGGDLYGSIGVAYSTIRAALPQNSGSDKIL